MQGGLLLDVVVGESTTVLKLLASEDETLLVRRNAFLILDLALDVVDGVRGLHLEGDSLAGHFEGDISMRSELRTKLKLGGVMIRRPPNRMEMRLTGLHEDLHDCGCSV